MNRKKQKKWVKFRHRVVTKIAYTVLYPYCRLKYGVHAENFEGEKDKPYLILYNHQTPFARWDFLYQDQYLFLTFSAKQTRSLISSFVPSSRMAVPFILPKT